MQCASEVASVVYEGVTQASVRKRDHNVTYSKENTYGFFRGPGRRAPSYRRAWGVEGGEFSSGAGCILSWKRRGELVVAALSLEIIYIHYLV